MIDRLLSNVMLVAKISTNDKSLSNENIALGIEVLIARGIRGDNVRGQEI